MSSKPEDFEKELHSSKEEIDAALELYDCIIDITSIKFLKKGWFIYGNEKFRYKKYDGRVVAFVGNFKSGKTWLIGRLLGVPLKGHNSNPTPGLCIIVPPSERELGTVENINATPSNVTVVSTPTKGAPPPKSKGPPPPSGNRSSPQAKVQPQRTFIDMIALDTQGTERPTAQEELDDVRATECFHRDLILNIAPRSIYVTAKFDRPAQVAITNLINQISLKKEKITSRNKLMVVHNYRDVSDETDLLERIAEVKKTYEKIALEEGWCDNSNEEEEGGVRKRFKEPVEEDSRPWLVTTIEGYTVYETPKTQHVFLVNDNAPISTNFNPKEFNDKAIKAIKIKITSDTPKRIDLVGSVMKESQNLLQKYIKDWKNYRLRLDKEYDRIMPMMRPKNTSFEQQEFNWDDNDESEYDEKFWFTPFKLPTMKFTDTGVISDSYHELPGEMYFNKEKIVFKIETPHLSDDDRNSDVIFVQPDKDRKTLRVWIDLKDRAEPKGLERGSVGFRKGMGYFNYDLEAQGIRYVYPKAKKDIYQDEHMKIVNGILTITLEAAPSTDDEDQDE